MYWSVHAHSCLPSARKTYFIWLVVFFFFSARLVQHLYYVKRTFGNSWRKFIGKVRSILIQCILNQFLLYWLKRSDILKALTVFVLLYECLWLKATRLCHFICKTRVNFFKYISMKILYWRGTALLKVATLCLTSRLHVGLAALLTYFALKKFKGLIWFLKLWTSVIPFRV